MKTLGTLFVLITILLCGWTWGKNKEIKGSGQLQSEIREVQNFSGIHTTRQIKVLLSQGKILSVKVEADDNLLKYIGTEVNNDVLKLTLPEDTIIKTSNDMTVYITTPEITDLKATTSGEIKGIIPWKCSSLNLQATTSGQIILEVEAPKALAKASTSGTIILDIQTNSLQATASTSGKMKLQGSAATLSTTASTSGNINALQLIAESVSATASTSGNIKVYAKQTFSGKASTSGNIRYKGNPTVNQSSTSTSGSISRIN